MSFGVSNEAMWDSALCLCRHIWLPICPATEGRVVLEAFFPLLHWALSWYKVHKERGEQRGNVLATFSCLKGLERR